MPRCPIKSAYNAHWNRAKAHGKGWYFTFETWVDWWEKKLGSDWLKKRGRTKDKYVMARFGDKGPYAEWNVKCITFSENCRERVANGSQAHGVNQGGCILTEDNVRTIFTESSCCMRELAHRFGIKHGTVSDIRRGLIWRRITGKLILSARCGCREKGIACTKGFTHRNYPQL